MLNFFFLVEILPNEGLGFLILLIGAMFTAAVVVTVFSFYVDDYWTDENYRETLRLGSRQMHATDKS